LKLTTTPTGWLSVSPSSSLPVATIPSGTCVSRMCCRLRLTLVLPSWCCCRSSSSPSVTLRWSSGGVPVATCALSRASPTIPPLP
ncbi:hypothetical protein BGZ54_003962, partial [Gamsiella multidivaricata]